MAVLFFYLALERCGSIWRLDDSLLEGAGLLMHYFCLFVSLGSSAIESPSFPDLSVLLIRPFFTAKTRSQLLAHIPALSTCIGRNTQSTERGPEAQLPLFARFWVHDAISHYEVIEHIMKRAVDLLLLRMYDKVVVIVCRRACPTRQLTKTSGAKPDVIAPHVPSTFDFAQLTSNHSSTKLTSVRPRSSRSLISNYRISIR